MTRPPLRRSTPPARRQKVQAAEDAWNTRDPETRRRGVLPGLGLAQPRPVPHRPRRDRRVPAARNGPASWSTRCARTCGRSTDNHIATRFQYECHDVDGQWWRSYGIELWEFDAEGYMRRREASINDLRIDAAGAPHPRPAPGSRAGRPTAAVALIARSGGRPAGPARYHAADARCVDDGGAHGGRADHRARGEAGARAGAHRVALARELAVGGGEHQLGAGAPGVVDEREARHAVDVLDALHGAHAGQAGQRQAQRARAGRRARGRCAGR